ncbi:MAG: GCN5-related N-acetyltransferase [uncultured bacterium]|nr:MAG: GCN5-related N-acetyltransferase [uncultured bacterium]KKP68643.1 MAG: GCN5-related N-acetyltransferase [Candidatus Moranbacteria bacterium GW2011_GWE1_35_17]KKP72857.1 MAG: GCN5-related N-acetyltransferase [Candidatus Moranbacteria bacterium GW2011_GWE2_35_164]KKP84078.1 MAG: GCN5-related N-acetyltransferase [Candidatus Moranbacteria bacterium GW2011_GWF1_35_5]KKP85042.1 MAG: GCN5-related N-acetyltransferase [Candidatus Moranbacteria bacterium GW2011_GWF2_35_54]HBR79328.1 hypothetical
MNDSILKYEKVSMDNLKLAIEIQNTIFPTENGALNLITYVDRSKIKEICENKSFRDVLDGWICKDETDEVVGITGIYSYFEYPQDAWCGWYGVLPEKQGKGYRKKILSWTMEKAREMGYKNFRLYTDLESNNAAVQLYRKIGMIEEPYVAEDMGSEQIIIFSKSLISEETKKFGNKNLFLLEQEGIQNKAEEFIKKHYSFLLG